MQGRDRDRALARRGDRREGQADRQARPRAVPEARDEVAQEPTMTEWKGAGRLPPTKDGASRVLVRVIRALTVLAAGTAATGCIELDTVLSYIDPPKPLPKIDGPEDERLLDDVRGTMLQYEGDDEFVLVGLPDHPPSKIKLRESADCLAGPDDQGR